MLRGVDPKFIEEMSFYEVQELYLYLQFFRKKINAEDLAMGISKAFKK